MERKGRAVARQTEPGCLLTALVVAFSVQEGFGDLGSCSINARSTRLWSTAVLTGARGLGRTALPARSWVRRGAVYPSKPSAALCAQTPLPGRKALDGLINPSPETLVCLKVAGTCEERGDGHRSLRGSTGGRQRREEHSSAQQSEGGQPRGRRWYLW